MKKLLLIGAIALLGLPVFAQNDKGKTDDVGRIIITPYVDANLNFNPQVTKLLFNKMNAVLTKQGLGGMPGQRFIITANIDVLSEDIVVTTKEMYQYELGVNFVIGDGFEGIQFATVTVPAKGLGDTKAGAYIDALKKISPSNAAFKPFITKAKDRIIEYYNSQCDFILKEAMAKADRKEYEAAIGQLVSIPTICKECFDKGQDASVEIYKRKIENDCQVNINQAKAAMAGNDWDGALGFIALYTPDLECYAEVAKLMKEIQDHRCADALARAQGAWAARNADEAAYWLAEVSADSKCYPDAQKLQKEIGSKLDADEQRNWDFMVQQHKDNVDIQKQAIKAARDIGVAYGENQQPTYNIVWW